MKFSAFTITAAALFIFSIVPQEIIAQWNADQKMSENVFKKIWSDKKMYHSELICGEQIVGFEMCDTARSYIYNIKLDTTEMSEDEKFGACNTVNVIYTYTPGSTLVNTAFFCKEIIHQGSLLKSFYIAAFHSIQSHGNVVCVLTDSTDTFVGTPQITFKYVRAYFLH